MPPDPVLEPLRELFATPGRAVISAYLFGSRAEGRAHTESDVDVGVLFDERLLGTRAMRSDAAIALNTELIAATHVNRVDVVVLNDAPIELSAHVVRTGIGVASADPARAHAFLRNTLLRAADLRPFLKRMRRIKLDALRR